jgi:hypothetical protein
MPVPDDSMKEKFVSEDLRDALRWLFVGAVTWEASRSQPHRCENQDVLGMFASLTQARALYEFFYGTKEQGDDARACHFASAWKPDKTDLYRRYMAARKPANKRLFHLVYNRASHAGGSGHDGPDHLKNQVLNFAKDLRGLTEQFAASVHTNFRGGVRHALQKALEEAKFAADHYGIATPL